jgi:hypothetical protein
VETFSSCFQVISSAAPEVSSHYLQGLYASNKRNCEEINKRIGRNSQSLNHFISNSPRDWH